MTTTRSLITDALRKIGVAAHDETPTADMISNGLRALNRFMRSLQNRGANLWAYSSLSLTCTATASHPLPVRPLEILSCRFTRDGVEMPMQALTRDEYDRLPVKTATGIPTTYYYDRQRDSARLLVWPVLATAAGKTLEISYVREFSEGDLNDETDIPDEFEDAVIYGLAARLADDYVISAPGVIARAEEELRLALAYDREGSVFFAGPYA